MLFSVIVLESTGAAASARSDTTSAEPVASHSSPGVEVGEAGVLAVLGCPAATWSSMRTHALKAVAMCDMDSSSAGMRTLHSASSRSVEGYVNMVERFPFHELTVAINTKHRASAP